LAQSAAAAISGLSERKRRAIQEAGTKVFLRRGYDSASMDLIAAEAGVSKQTIYNHFRSKDDLFREIIADITKSLFGPLSMSEAARSTPARQLRSFGQDFLALQLQPSSLALHRLVIAASARFPGLGAELFAVGPGRLIRVLADYLRMETKRGRLAVDDPERAAELFIGMLSGRVQLRALLGVRKTMSQAEIDSRVDDCVSDFIALYGEK